MGKEGEALKRAWLIGVAWLLWALPSLAQQGLSPLWTRPAHQGFVGAAAFSPDGRYFVSGLGDIEGGQVTPSLHLWDGLQGSYLRTLSPEYYDIQATRFSPDGSLLIAGGVGTPVFVRDVQSDRILVSYAQYPTDIAISQDGQTVVFAGWGWVTVWKGFQRIYWNTAPVHYTMLRVALLPDAQRLATISVPYRPSYFIGGSPGSTVALWSIQDGSLLWTRELPANTTGVAVSPDGTHIAVGREDGLVSVLDADTGQVVTDLSGLGYDALVQFSPDGSFLAAAGGLAPYLFDGALRLWRTSDYALVNEIPLQGVPSVLAIAPSQTVAAVGYSNGELEWITLPDGSSRRWLAYARMAFPSTYAPAKALRFSPDSRRFAESRINGVFVVDTQTGRDISMLPYAPCIISPDLRWVAHRGENRLTVRRLSDGEAVLTFEGNTARYAHVIFSEDSRFLALAINEPYRERLQLYSTGNWQRIWEVALPPYLMMRDGWFSPKSTYLALHGGTAVVLRVSDGAIILDLQRRLDYPFVDAVAFSADERRFAAANEAYVHVYNLPGGEHIWTSPTVSNPQEVWRLGFSSDGRHLLWLGLGSLIVWETNTWSKRLETEAYDAVFTPDSRALVLSGRMTRSSTYRVNLLRLSDMRLIASASEGASRLWVSPDSRYILYLQGNGSLRAVRNPLVPVAVPRPLGR